MRAALTHTGIGLRQPHYDALLGADAPAAAPGPAFVEVHSENFFAAGGASLGVLRAARARWPVSLHGVGLSLGSAAGIDARHLQSLVDLVQRIDPVRVSDHACFARASLGGGGPVLHGSDLLPIAFTDAALQIMVDNVQRVQEALKRTILVENLSAYVHWQDNSWPEPAFLSALAQRSGCGLLLDVNNLVVNALNDGADESAAGDRACAWVDQIDPRHVGEIHLAGYQDCGDIVIDDHGSAVHAPVWQVFAHTVQRLGPRPTLIEWDTDLPALHVLLQEAARADAMLVAAASS
jgi:uncharacterized protein